MTDAYSTYEMADNKPQTRLRSYEMPAISSNEATYEALTTTTQQATDIYQDIQKSSDSERDLTNAMSNKTTNKKRAKKRCSIAIMLLVVFLSVLLTLGAFALTAVNYVNLSIHQSEFRKLTGQVKELAIDTERNILQILNQQNNASQDRMRFTEQVSRLERKINTRITNNISTLYSVISQLTDTVQSNISHIFNQLHNTDQYHRNLMKNLTLLGNQLHQIASENVNISVMLSDMDATIQDEIESLQTHISSLQVQIHCGAGPWYHIAHLNMSNPTEQCPSVWREYNIGVRACGRPNSVGESCPATLYTSDRQYSRVCGRVIGYQYDSPDAFTDANANNVSQRYMDGVSITHGSPRNHIWSYVAGATETSLSHGHANCPCATAGAVRPPLFVGDNYYCESGNPANFFVYNQLYSNDSLWDGQQCEGTCCSGTTSPPWFSVQLPAPTIDMIEVRICGDETSRHEDTPIELLDIFVQ